jgi:hypothetical protein
MWQTVDSPRWRQADPVGDYTKCRKVLAELGMADASGEVTTDIFQFITKSHSALKVKIKVWLLIS